MKCSHCQFENPPSNTVCEGCGTVLNPHFGVKKTHAGSTVPGNLLLGNEEELRAKAEWLAKRIQAKRALAAKLSALSDSARNPLPSISKIETEMSLIVGGIFVGAIALSFTAVYFDMPGHEAETVRGRVADLVSDARKEAVGEAQADTRPQTVATAQTALQPESGRPFKAAPSAATVEVSDVEPTPLEGAATAASSSTALQDTSNTVTVPKAGSNAMENSAADFSKPVHSKRNAKHRAQQLAASCVPTHQGKCNPQYVVSFKRFWGPVLEERVYPNRKMTSRARTLWDREGKILEADGTINDKYVVKPKTFSPIPGFPAS